MIEGPSQSDASLVRRLVRLPLWKRMAILWATMGLVLGVAVAVSAVLAAGNGALAAGVAWALCLAGATAALAASQFFRDGHSVFYGLLAAMALRMALPLGGGLAIHFQGGTLANAGFIYYLLVFYLLALFVETLLSLPDTARRSPRSSD